jgi:anaerobic selenocysteine-containing dehydrogenase
MAIRPAVAPPESTVQTACPLDCPDACTLQVTLRGGRITTIDGSHDNPVTGGYICAKVRRFDRRVYGEDRLHFPAVRVGAKGAGRFRRVSWDDALDTIADRFDRIRREHGGDAILPLSYGGSNGLLTQDANDAAFFRRLGALQLARTVCAAPTGAANLALYGKMPSVAYQDYAEARLIVVWGANPSASGIHLMPYLKEARGRGATLVVVDPRATTVARQADLHLMIRPGTDLALALAVHRHLFESGAADLAFLEAHTTGWQELRARAAAWTFERAAEVTGLRAADIERLASLYAAARPALVKCGWGLERNRNGGSAAAAVLALPAVANKFGVRGGGYSMSNSASWGIAPGWLADAAPATRVVNMNRIGRELTAPDGPPIRGLFVYNCNPAVTLPDQSRVLEGLAREDLFTVVFDQVLTDTAMYADVVLPATTFLEHYDTAKAYGAISLFLTRPVIEPVAEARPNADVFAELTARLGLSRDDDAVGELDQMLRVLDHLPGDAGRELGERGGAPPPWDGRPVQFVDVFPRTPDGRIGLCPPGLDAEAPLGLYGYQPDPATEEYPLALISPATERTISSTLGELLPQVRLEMHPADATARGLGDGDDVRVWNALGVLECQVKLTELVRQGTVSFPKGVWRRHTANGLTSNVLVPDTLTDVGGGACFNDARVEVRRLPREKDGRRS